MKLDSLQEADLPAALALSGAEGWNQTGADWSRLVRLEPSGCFAVREVDRLAGTVATLAYGRELAWIGMMIIHPDFRRRGIGAQLMRAALDYAHRLGIRTVKLDATPAGQPLYESLGFVAETEMERWQGVASPGSSGMAVPLAQATPGTLSERDRAAFGLDRLCLLEQLLADCPTAPVVTNDGFALSRPGRIATYIGPVVADSEAAATSLLDGQLTTHSGREVCLDVHARGYLRREWLLERGLTVRRGLVRMSHGPRTGHGTSPASCASAGPEYG